MSAPYFSLKRFFTWSTGNGDGWTVFYCANDLTKSEVELLLEIFERDVAWMAEHDQDNFYDIRLEPSAGEDPARFVELAHRWDAIETDRLTASSHWADEVTIRLFNQAFSYAEQIRRLRSAQTARYFLACDTGSGEPEVFNVVDCLTEAEVDTLEEVLSPEIREGGGILYVFSEDEAERDPALHLTLLREWRVFQGLKADGHEPNHLWAQEISESVIEDILSLREHWAARRAISDDTLAPENDDDDSAQCDAIETDPPSNGAELTDKSAKLAPEDVSILFVLRASGNVTMTNERIEAAIERMAKTAKDEQTEIAATLVPISVRTISARLKGLMDRGYVIRPNGRKGGCSITDLGLAAIEQLR